MSGFKLVRQESGFDLSLSTVEYILSPGDGVGPTGATGAVGGTTEIDIENADLDGSFDYNVNHAGGIDHIPLHSLSDNNGNAVLVQIQKVDTNNFKIKFGRAITGTWRFSYLG